VPVPYHLALATILLHAHTPEKVFVTKMSIQNCKMKYAVFTCFEVEETDLQSEKSAPSCVVLKYDPLNSKTFLPPNTALH
jgi:hypothetical protein